MKKSTTVIIGANSEIAKALARSIVAENGALIVITRNKASYKPSNETKVITVENYQEDSIVDALEQVRNEGITNINQVFICHGVLHNEQCQPEKKLEDFSPDAFNEIININTITPMIWLKHLVLTLAIKEPCRVVVFSARVGSIGDNKLGGWYSYRTSKTALNMLLKTASIELARRAKHIKLISFHPGTTDTPLSKPFQKNVPASKLFSPEFVAKQLLAIVSNSPIDGELAYIDWQGKRIDW